MGCVRWGLEAETMTTPSRFARSSASFWPPSAQACADACMSGTRSEEHGGKTAVCARAAARAYSRPSLQGCCDVQRPSALPQAKLYRALGLGLRVEGVGTWGRAIWCQPWQRMTVSMKMKFTVKVLALISLEYQ